MEQVAAEASAGEEEIIQFLQDHTLVGLLPVPHPSEISASTSAVVLLVAECDTLALAGAVAVALATT